MKKQILLAAAAVSAIAFAGAANAASLSYRAGAGAVTDSSANPYLLARELNFGTGVTSTAGQFDTVVNFNGAGIPAGTYNFTITYDAGATFAVAQTAATVTSTGTETAAATNVTGSIGFQSAVGAGSTLTLTSGGTVGSNSATYTLFVPAGATVSSIAVSGGLRVTGAVRVSTNIINQTTNTAFEPGFSNLLLLSNTGVGFASRVLGALDLTATTTGADEDTRIISNGGLFNQLAGVATAPGVTEVAPYQVGQFQIAAATTAGALNGFPGFTTAATQPSPIVYKDLIGTAVSIADVTSSSVTIQGQLAGLTFSAVGAGTFTVTSPTTQATNILNTTPAALTTIRVAPTSTAANAPQLSPTALPVTSQLFLGSAFLNPAAGAGNLEQLQTDGFTYIVPWVSSATQAGASGNQTIIRISNINPEINPTTNGAVYAQLINPVNAAGVTNPGRAVRVGVLDANGELIINSATLEAAFGNFQRADIRLTITTVAATGNNIPAAAAGVGASSIVVKRIIANAAGGLTEMTVLGDDGSVTNLPTNQGVDY
jgi:hypothetical protein